MIPQFFIISFILFHPSHVTYSNIEVNFDKKEIIVSHKFDVNDFSLLFYHMFEKSVEPIKGSELDISDLQLLNSYINDRFILSCSTDTINLEYSHKDQDEESLWLYYSGKLPANNLKTLNINNMLFFDLYMDETNLVIARYGKKEEGFMFNWDNHESVLSLEQ